jgi:hypothetical protein
MALVFKVCTGCADDVKVQPEAKPYQALKYLIYYKNVRFENGRNTGFESAILRAMRRVIYFQHYSLFLPGIQRCSPKLPS